MIEYDKNYPFLYNTVQYMLYLNCDKYMDHVIATFMNTKAFAAFLNPVCIIIRMEYRNLITHKIYSKHSAFISISANLKSVQF